LDDEKFCRPEKFYPNGALKTQGMKNGSYDKLDENGFVRVGTYVDSNDVIMGKVIPLKMKNENDPQYKDASVMLRTHESGYVDKVYVNKNGDGYKFCKVRVRMERYPIIGDKFASRHAQKGTISMIYPQEDMPYTMDGVIPDIILNPNAIPSRLTIGQIIECACSKVGVMKGMFVDGTPFENFDPYEIGAILENYCGYSSTGTEYMFNGRTGKMIETMIFVGPTFYYRLKHLVQEKVHARATGPYQILTRQPADGRSRDGGFRIGEMERDSILSHGAVQFLKERTFDCSDKYLVYVCKECGIIAQANPSKNLFRCSFCKNQSSFAQVQIPYASKLLMQEIMSMSIVPRLFTRKIKFA
jgi:DNA-directed RNA polymerase II subunit RPB2